MNTIQVTQNHTESSIFMDDINAIDFGMIKRKLRDKDEGLGWTN